MVEIVIIAGLVIAIVEAIKKYLNIPEELYFVPVLTLAVVLNAANAYFFGADVMTVKEAVLEGIKLGAQIAGIYGLGKPIVKDFLERIL
jgi:hypothetical protein